MKPHIPDAFEDSSEKKTKTCYDTLTMHCLVVEKSAERSGGTQIQEVWGTCQTCTPPPPCAFCGGW